ncbi:unnamed protein product [Urochloa decumbens]|uniref:Uncharacterized protein n=1 Tax=Urochloa decumbens TaxID=240449 RepID=A0ABC9E0S4_9POAL
MTDDERRQTIAEEGRAVPVRADSPTPPEIDEDAAAGAAAAAPPPPPAKSLALAEEGLTATSREPCRTAKAQENFEFGAGIAGSGISMMVAWYFLSPEARGAYNLRYVMPMLLGSACIASGVSLMLLNMNILNLPENLVSDAQHTASGCFSLLCSTLPVLTLLSPLVLSGYKVYRYIGLTLLVIVTAPLAVLRWYIGRKAEGGDDNDQHAALKEHEEKLEAAFKFISAISSSAFGALISLIANYNVTDGSGRTKGAVLVATFFIFTTGIWGVLSMEIRMKVLGIKSRRMRGFIVEVLWLAIFFMLVSLACAIFAEVIAMVGFGIFAAFTPWVFASTVYLFLDYCIHPSRRVPMDNTANMSLEVQLKLRNDRGIKITMWSFMAIIGIFGGFLHGHNKIESLKACIILLTSSFMSAFALTLLTIRPNTTSRSLAAATKVLDWTAAMTLAAAIFAVIVAMILEIQ